MYTLFEGTTMVYVVCFVEIYVYKWFFIDIYGSSKVLIFALVMPSEKKNCSIDR